MADTGIFATTLECQEKAGANASSTANTEAYINSYISQAESRINVESEYNWSDAYSSLSSDVKKILTEAASNLVAIYILNYDPDAVGRDTAIFRVNLLYTQYLDIIKILRETDKGQIFIKEAS